MKAYRPDKTKIAIAVVLLVAAQASHWAAIAYPRSRDFWIGLCGGILTMIFTVFFVDYLIERSQKMRWRVVRNVAKDDLAILTNGMVTWFAAPMGYGFHEFVAAYPDADMEGDAIVRWYIHELTHHTATELLEGMSAADWKHLDTSMRLLRFELAEKINLYKEAVPPEVLGDLLAVNKAFTSFWQTYMLVPEYFTRPSDQWPSNNDGTTGNQRNRQLFLSNMAADFDKYMTAVKGLRSALEHFDDL